MLTRLLSCAALVQGVKRRVCHHSSPQQPGGQRRARGERMGPGYITADLGKEEQRSLRSTRWCCEHTDTRVLHTAEFLLSLITPSRSSWPRHQWFRGRSVHLLPPWGKRRTKPRRVHLDDLVGCPSHCLAPRGCPSPVCQGVALFEGNQQIGVQWHLPTSTKLLPPCSIQGHPRGKQITDN